MGADSGQAVSGRQDQPVVLRATAPASLIGPPGTRGAVPLGIPDLDNLKIQVSPDGKLALVTSDGQRWSAETHVEGDRVMFGADLPQGATISGVLHVSSTLPYVVALVIKDEQGTIFSGRQEFAPEGPGAPAVTGPPMSRRDAGGAGGATSAEACRCGQAPAASVSGLPGNLMDAAFSGETSEH